ncbi:MAG: helix-turn-helix domain-containing protein [Treponema sp.]
MDAKDIRIRLGENLKRIRKEHKLTQFELAEKANVSEDTVKSIELMRFWPSEKTLSQISSALGIDVYHFFMPTEGTINTDKAVLESLKATILKTYFAYVEDALKSLQKL